MSEEQIKYLKWKRVHFKWYNSWCNWSFRRQEWDKAICITPKTRKEFIGKISDMYPSAKCNDSYYKSLI